MRVEPSFVGGVIDDMLKVPDAASIATMRWVSSILGRPVGGSTGTNVWASLQLIGDMRAADEEGSVVTLLCDGGERYQHTYYDDAWLAAKGLDITPYAAALAEFDRTGVLPAV
jgi:cysteine synthase A